MNEFIAGAIVLGYLVAGVLFPPLPAAHLGLAVRYRRDRHALGHRARGALLANLLRAAALTLIIVAIVRKNLPRGDNVDAEINP